MGQKFKIIFVLFLSFLSLIVVLFANEFIKQDQSARDSDALFGGRLEKGFPSAGFLVANTSQGVKSCGYAVLSPTIAITASHCVDDSSSILLGLGEFDYSNVNKVVVNTAIQKAGWVNTKNRRDDFSILRFGDSSTFFTDFAEIDRVSEGCNYRVVAYGRTENIDEYGRFPRKSAKLCAFEIDNDIFRVRADSSEKAGICFGDSGSPVYIDGTNKVIGVVASILNNPNRASSDQCDFNNTGIVVRADTNINFVNQSIQLASNDTFNRELDRDIVVQVVDQSVFARLGLRFLDNLDNTQKIVSIGLITIGILTIFLSIYFLFSGKRKTI